MLHIFSKQNKALLSELVRTDFKLRYQGSVLGYAWSLLKPLMIFLILYVVFVKVFKFGDDIPHFPVYLLLGIVLWNFFTDMTTQSVGAIVDRGDLIRKIKIPRWSIVVSSSLSALINLFLNMIVIVIFMVVSGVDVSSTILWFPLILVEIYVFSLGVSLFLAALFVKYRDISYIWEVVTQILFYATPILYPLTKVDSNVFKELILLNPMAQAIQDARYGAVTNQTLTAAHVFPSPLLQALPYVIAVAALVIGALYFRKESKYFAENI